MEISDRIKKRRQNLGLTLEEVAEKLGVAKSTVLRYETKDIGNMGIDKLALLAFALKCTPAYLMGWEDEDKQNNHTKESEDDSHVPSKFLALFNKLNDLGKKEAVKRVEELTHIPKYQEHYVLAAHNDAELTDEEIELMKQDLDEL